MEGIGLGTSIVLSKQWIHLFNEIRASEGMFSLPLPRGVHSWCCVTSSLSICTTPPAICAAVPNSCTNGGNKISHWSTAPAEWFFSMRSMMKLDVNWLKHAGWKMVRLSLMHSSSPHVILSYELWYYYSSCNWYSQMVRTYLYHISTCDVPTDISCIHSEYIYIYTYQHQIFEYTVCKVILPLAHGHPQCILRATSLNDPRSTEQAYRQKECGQGAFPKRDAKKPCQLLAQTSEHKVR